jgi:hypothetical protein
MKAPEGFAFGICEGCKFRGLVRPKLLIGKDFIDPISGTARDDNPPGLMFCITCYETGAGLTSDNAVHERLPKSEYDRDKKP